VLKVAPREFPVLRIRLAGSPVVTASSLASALLFFFLFLFLFLFFVFFFLSCFAFFLRALATTAV
jgi:hypothetical protein